MDLHPPGGPVRSLKDFFVHIGVVTLGILIALGLEQLVEVHHRAGVQRFGIDAAALTKDQRTTLIQELRRYGNALTVIEFAGRGALKSCDAAQK